MPVQQEITEGLIHQYIKRAVGDVFKTMLGREAKLIKGTEQAADEPWPPLHSGREGAKPHVVGTVGFLGDVNGLIYFYLPLEFARICTCQLLSMTDDELTEAGEEAINDAIAEITNMTVGGFKNSLCDAGYSCKLTIPSILVGSNFCIEPISNTTRHIYHFDCSGHRIVADILMKIGD
jgi:chemotaxis protein CheX